MATVTSKDGTTIVFDKLGDGPAVILVTGATSTRGINTELAELLAANFTVINYDRRGRGESGNNSPEASLEREIEDIGALITEAGGSAALYGISSGGALVLEAAASGLNVGKVAVYEVPYSVNEDARQRAREYSRNLAAAVAEGRNGDAADLFLGLVGLPPEMIDGMHHAPIWPDMVAVAPSLVFDAEALGMASRGGAMPEERIASITAPTLVLDGSATWPWIREVQPRIAKTLPNAEYDTLDDQTHDVSPAVLAPRLTKFFS